MTAEDLDEVEQLHLKLFPIIYSHESYQDYLLPTFCSLVLVEKDTGKIVGVSTAIRKWKNLIGTERVAYLATFGIAEEHRRQHLGTMLLRLTAQILREHYGCTSLSLHTAGDNKSAVKFYESNGLMSVSFIPDFYSVKLPNRNAILIEGDLVDIPLPDPSSFVALSLEIETLIQNQRSVSIWTRLFGNP